LRNAAIMSWKNLCSWPNVKYRPDIWLEGLRKGAINLVRIVPTEIRTWHIPNTSQKPYRFGHLARYSQIL